ncbi:MAG: FAD-dependent oxidoreductase, partial [Actinobacteria bacterium]|nr:FAD-dependent oxidoreductase [Actinomycetota bacterium]
MHIIVVGGGLAGLVAALRATELGARVTLLEKGGRLGGSFVYSSGYVWSYKDLATFRGEAPGGDITLQRLILERLWSGLEWLEDRGAPPLTRETGNPLTIGARLDPERAVAALAERTAASGGRILLGTALDGLVQDPAGCVAGVRTVSGEKRSTEGVDAVILASGGFAGNPELVGRHIVRGPGRLRLRAH